jgi:hypothetical protein
VQIGLDVQIIDQLSLGMYIQNSEFDSMSLSSSKFYNRFVQPLDLPLTAPNDVCSRYETISEFLVQALRPHKHKITSFGNGRAQFCKPPNQGPNKRICMSNPATAPQLALSILYSVRGLHKMRCKYLRFKGVYASRKRFACPMLYYNMTLDSTHVVELLQLCR